MLIIQKNKKMFTIRKSFTINPNRTKEEIRSYKILLENKTYVGVEIFYPYNRDEEGKKELTNALKEYLEIPGVEFVCHLPHGKFNNLATDVNIEEVMDRFKKAIDYAFEFGVKKLTLHPGECDGTLSRSDAINKASKHIKELCQYANKYDMTIMLENLIGENELMRIPSEYFELKEKIAEKNLKFIFDLAHFHASKFDNGDSSNIKWFVNEIKNDLLHVHMSDNDGLKDLHARIGTGNIDYKTYINCLKKIDYKGLYSSEVLFNTVDDLIQTAIDLDNLLK